MKLNDVANQLKLLLPQYSTKFSDYLTASSITSDGSVTTIVFTGAHGLTTGNTLIFNSVARRTPISAVSQVGLNFTFTTSAPHDLTMNWYRNPKDKTTLNQVQLGGFTVAGWNQTHTLGAVPNRESFTIQSALAAPVLNGGEYLLEIDSAGLYGAKTVAVVNATTVTVSGVKAGTYSGGTISKVPRVLVAMNAQDFWARLVTPPSVNQNWIGIIPQDVSVSKDRSTLSDAIAERSKGEEFRLRLIDGFIILILIPAETQTAGALALDEARHTLRSVIYKCVMGMKLPTGVTNEGYMKVVPVDDGMVKYDVSKLIYQYTFQYPYDLTEEDCVPSDQTSAFRDIDYTLEVGDGMTAGIDLDDEPIEP